MVLEINKDFPHFVFETYSMNKWETRIKFPRKDHIGLRSKPLIATDHLIINANVTTIKVKVKEDHLIINANVTSCDSQPVKVKVKVSLSIAIQNLLKYDEIEREELKLCWNNAT